MKRLVFTTLAFLLLGVSTAFASPTEVGGEYEWAGSRHVSEWQPVQDSEGAYRWGLDSEGNLEVLYRNNPSDGGSVQRKWTTQEWEASRGEVEVEAECLGRTDNCVKDIDEGETRLPRGVPQPEIEKGAEVITDLRDEAPYGPEPAVTEGLDAVGEWGATLDAGALAAAAGTLTGGLLLGPLVFKTGVAIGNELDQLFGFPEWLWGEDKAQAENARKSKADITYAEDNGVYRGPPGYILTGGSACDGELFCSYSEIEETARAVGTTGDQITCYNSEGTTPTTCETGYPPLKVALVCPAPASNTDCEPPPKFKEEDAPAAGAEGGIPVPNNSGIEDENEDHEEGPYSSRKKLPRLPVAPTATTNAPKLPQKGHKREPVLPEERVKEALGNPPVSETVVPPEHAAAEEAKEREEADKKPLPEAYPGETAKQYQKRLEGLGFTDVFIQELGELNENPDVGPEQVATVTPHPGEEVGSGTKITIGENPKTAPEPGSKEDGGGEPGAGTTGPSPPGFKFPDFGILCKGFPFGVPCWLAKTVESWSVTGKAPELGIEEIELDHRKIPAGMFDLAHLEPEMEIIRPAMVIFATIGLVLLFYRFAKGGSAPSGSQGDSDGGEGEQ